MATTATRIGPKVSLLVHLLIFSWYLFTIWSNCSLQTSDRHPGVRSYGGRWKYLTFINLVGTVLTESVNVTAVSYDRVFMSHLYFFLFLFVVGNAGGVFWIVCVSGCNTHRSAGETDSERDSSDAHQSQRLLLHCSSVSCRDCE